jgi:hypothetical protein
VRELSLGLGLWAVFAPFVLKFTGAGAAASAHVLVGLAVTALAAFALMQSDGGQRPRWRTRAP